MKVLLRLALVLCIVSGIGYSVGGDSLLSNAYAADCVASNSLSETAQSYIGRCRKGSISWGDAFKNSGRDQEWQQCGS